MSSHNLDRCGQSSASWAALENDGYRALHESLPTEARHLHNLDLVRSDPVESGRAFRNTCVAGTEPIGFELALPKSQRKGPTVRLVHRALRSLTYANVMATLAVVIACGGSAYAATKINGHEIKKHTLPASALVKGAVVPKAASAGRVSRILITHAKRHAKRKRKAVAVLSSADPTFGTTNMVSISAGQTVTLLQSGPFTVTGSCVDDGNGAYHVLVRGTASTDFYDQGEHLSAGEKHTFYDGDSSSKAGSSVPAPGDGMFTAGGDSLIETSLATAVHLYGDCAVSMSVVTQ